MFLKVRKLQSIEKLILETDLIQIGDEANDILNKAKADDTSGAGSTGDNNEDLNRLLDMLFNLGEDELTGKLDDPALSKIFSDPKMQKTLEGYFAYLQERIKVFREELMKALNEVPVNEAKVGQITDKITKFVCRVRVIELIYQNKASKKKSGEQDFSEEINKKVSEINDELYNLYSLMVIIPADKTKQSYAKFQGAQNQEEKEEAAKEVFSNLEAAEILAAEMPEEVSAGIEDATDTYTSQISSELGNDVTADIKAGVYVNKNVASLIRRIFEFQHTNWTNENDILMEANKLRTSVNGFPDVSTEAKEYLLRLIDQIQVSLIERSKNKQFDTKKYKGIHYDFNKKLPLYERTSLPVNGKQIADETKLMKFRKAAQSLMDLIFGGEKTGGVTAQAFERTGKWAHAIYAKTLNGAAKVIGKAVKGREGEMKADAFSRLFIFDTSVVDEPKTKQVSEDGVAPGVSPQVPGSIGGMGAITPPTETSFGSGDNFGIQKKGKKKKYGVVLGFADFIKEQNNL
jgi:hypothetical protein